MPALLMECAFIDSNKDMNNYNADEVSECIFKGICSVFSIQKANSASYHIVSKGDTIWSI